MVELNYSRYYSLHIITFDIPRYSPLLSESIFGLHLCEQLIITKTSADRISNRTGFDEVWIKTGQEILIL
jgi:hypothetical protein